ncbi:MAG: hypothetical protein WBQ04_07515, partial [Candidatus Acidiferrales bacterium]
FRAQLALRLIGPNQWNFTRRILILIAIGWLPLLIITAVLNPEGLPSLIREYPIHARMLIAVPVLLVGESFMESRFRLVMQHIRQVGILDTLDLAYMDGVNATLIRVRDASLPELVIFVLLVVHTATSYRGLVDATPWLGHGSAADLHLTVAGWYAVLVSAPLFQFLLGLGLWEWLLWTWFAFKLSRQNLRLVPTHPDEHGGLGFLGLTAAAFAPVAFAATAVIGATWRDDILHHGARLMDFKLEAIVLLMVIVLVALGPLLFFVPRLASLRRQGILEYGILGQIHSTEFHEKWILNRAGHETEFLQSPDSTTLANFGKTYQEIAHLKPFPADMGALYGLAAAVAIPALPVVLAQIPLKVVVMNLLRTLR